MNFQTLVTPLLLNENPQWKIFDCRHQLSDREAGGRAYAQSHIPGALHAHMDIDLSSETTGRNGRHPLPDPQKFAKWLGSCGIAPADQVVVYDANDGSFAARLWWLLRATGHRSVAVLDGGFQLWTSLGLPTTSEVPLVRATEYPQNWRPSLVNVTHVLENIASQDAILIDARGAGRYAGQGETVDPVAGHIPGALNRPFTDNIKDGVFKPPEDLAKDFRSLIGGRRASEVIHQCGSGVTACHNILAMEIAGLGGSRLYPGSWSEWCSDPSRPVATGPEPGASNIVNLSQLSKASHA